MRGRSHSCAGHQTPSPGWRTAPNTDSDTDTDTDTDATDAETDTGTETNPETAAGANLGTGPRSSATAEFRCVL